VGVFMALFGDDCRERASLISDIVMELQLTPARGVWEKDGKSKQHNGRW
jgi:hypothetical protein